MLQILRNHSTVRPSHIQFYKSLRVIQNSKHYKATGSVGLSIIFALVQCLMAFRTQSYLGILGVN